MLGRIGFAPVQWKVRRGLSGPAPSTPEAQKLEALQTGPKPYAAACQRRTRPHRLRRRYPRAYRIEHHPGKTRTLIRTAHYFLRERHIKECPLRFDVVAIDRTPGQPAVVRLQKSALSPIVHRHSNW